jgi:hypothetical protein
MVSWVKIATVFFYNTIKQTFRQMIGGVLGTVITISDDILLALIGWFLMKKGGGWGEFGEGLLLGAVASIGATGGITLGGLFAPAPQQQSQQKEVEVIR